MKITEGRPIFILFRPLHVWNVCKNYRGRTISYTAFKVSYSYFLFKNCKERTLSYIAFSNLQRNLILVLHNVDYFCAIMPDGKYIFGFMYRGSILRFKVRLRIIILITHQKWQIRPLWKLILKNIEDVLFEVSPRSFFWSLCAWLDLMTYDSHLNYKRTKRDFRNELN